MKLYRTTHGIFVEEEGSFYPVNASGWDELIASADLQRYVRAAIERVQSVNRTSSEGGQRIDIDDADVLTVAGRCRKISLNFTP